MDMKVALQQRRSFDEFYDHVTHTGSQLEEIAGDLYDLESMISLARDVEDLRLYQAHCRVVQEIIQQLPQQKSPSSFIPCEMKSKKISQPH